MIHFQTAKNVIPQAKNGKISRLLMPAKLGAAGGATSVVARK
jgi:hypothetical protein